MENNKMFKSLYDRILSVKFLNTVLIGCAVMGGACSLSHPITDMTTKEKAWEEFSHPVLLLKANESCLKFYASNNDSNPPNKENIPPKFPRLK